MNIVSAFETQNTDYILSFIDGIQFYIYEVEIESRSNLKMECKSVRELLKECLELAYYYYEHNEEYIEILNKINDAFYNIKLVCS